MSRISLAVLVLLLAGPEPAPEVTYTLRFEETGVTTTAGPNPEGALTSTPEVAPEPNEVLRLLTEVQLIVNQPFRVKTQMSDSTRILSGVAKVDPDVTLPGYLRFRLEYSVDYKDERGLPASRRVETDLGLQPGRRQLVCGTKQQIQQTAGEKPKQTRTSFNVWATLLKPQVTK